MEVGTCRRQDTDFDFTGSIPGDALLIKMKGKPIYNFKDIIDVIRESVDVIEILKPIYNFKASE